MMLVGHWPAQLTGSIKFHWSNQGFRYLGIIITPEAPQLYKANYGKLMGEIKNDLIRWEVLPLSLIGRVETIRMNILPRLLFMFQSLAIEVPTSTFKLIDNWLSKFIWQNRRPRIRLKRLLCTKENRGLDLPNLKKYYWAAQLRALVAWISQDKDTIWVGMEQNDYLNLSLDTIPFLNQNTWKINKIDNQWVKTTLRIWSIVKKKLRLPVSISRALKIAPNTDFLPSKLGTGFKKWERNGLAMFDQLFDGEVLMSYGQLRHKYNLPAHDFF